MSGPKRRRTTSMQTRSSAAGPSTSTPTESPIASQSSHSSSHVDSSTTDQVPTTSITTRARSSASTTTPKRQRHCPSEGSVPETTPVSPSSSTLTSNNSETSSRRIGSPASRVDTTTNNDVILWIRENYEMMPNSNVPRSGIYEHYRHYCLIQQCQHVNAATFGKLIRMAFPNISTRRLGNRGQSKYQYCNIQRRDIDTNVTGAGSTETNITTTTESSQANMYVQPSLSSSSGVSLQDSVAIASGVLADLYAGTKDGMTHPSTTTATSSSNQATTSTSTVQQHHHRHNPHHYHRRHNPHHYYHQEGVFYNNPPHSLSSVGGYPAYRLPPPSSLMSASSSPSSPSSSSAAAMKSVTTASTYIPGGNLVSDFSTTLRRPTAIPSSVSSSSGPSTSTSLHVASTIILPPVDPKAPVPPSASPSSSSSSNLEYLQSTNTWDSLDLFNQFANSYNIHCQDIYNAILEGNFSKLQHIYVSFYDIMQNKYSSLVNKNEVIESIWRWDCKLYDKLIVDLLPKVNTETTEHMMAGLRHFTRYLPQFLSFLLQNYPAVLKKNKVDVASIFVAKMRRHLTLNQFAIAAGDVIRQPLLLEAMMLDWRQLDIGAILDHVLWVCDCRNDVMQQILNRDIAHLLASGTTLEQWMEWMEKLIDKFLPHLTKIREIQNIEEYLTQAKQFVLKWKMYSALIIQQFSIMGVESIESFKTLQSFFDDLVLYYVEERISKMNADINRRLSPSRASTINYPFSSSDQTTYNKQPNRQD